nr:hypothetical protein [Tanacetum cinerariifolium]
MLTGSGFFKSQDFCPKSKPQNSLPGSFPQRGGSCRIELKLGTRFEDEKGKELFNDLDGDEVVVDILAGEKEERRDKVAEKKVSTADPVNTAGEVVTTVDVEVSVSLITIITIDDAMNLAQILVEIKATKPKALTTTATIVTAVSIRPKEKGIIMQDPSKTPSPKPIVSSQQPSQPKGKGEAKMVEPERPLKRKEQIIMDEQTARDLKAQIQANLEEVQRIPKEKEEEANIAMIAEWDNTQAMMDTDY